MQVVFYLILSNHHCWRIREISFQAVWVIWCLYSLLLLGVSCVADDGWLLAVIGWLVGLLSRGMYIQDEWETSEVAESGPVTREITHDLGVESQVLNPGVLIQSTACPHLSAVVGLRLRPCRASHFQSFIILLMPGYGRATMQSMLQTHMCWTRVYICVVWNSRMFRREMCCAAKLVNKRSL